MVVRFRGRFHSLVKRGEPPVRGNHSLNGNFISPFGSELSGTVGDTGVVVGFRHKIDPSVNGSSPDEDFCMKVGLGQLTGNQIGLRPGEYICGSSRDCDIIIPTITHGEAFRLSLDLEARTVSITALAADIAESMEFLPQGEKKVFGRPALLDCSGTPIRIWMPCWEVVGSPSPNTEASTSGFQAALPPGAFGWLPALPRPAFPLPAVLGALSLIAALAAMTVLWSLPSRPSDVPAGLANAEITSPSQAIAVLKRNLASADIVSPHEIKLSGDTIVVSGKLTARDHARLNQILTAFAPKSSVAVRSDIAILDTGENDFIAAVTLKPVAALISKSGQMYQVGDVVADMRKVVDIDASSVVLSRDGYVERIKITR